MWNNGESGKLSPDWKIASGWLVCRNTWRNSALALLARVNVWTFSAMMNQTVTDRMAMMAVISQPDVEACLSANSRPVARGNGILAVIGGVSR